MDDGKKKPAQLHRELVDARRQIEALRQQTAEQKDAVTLLRVQSELGIALSSTSSLAETLELVLNAVLHISDIDSGGIYLVNEETGELNLAVHRGVPTEFVQTASHFAADAPQTRLVKQGRPVYCRYVDMVPQPDAVRLQTGLQAVAVLPVLHQGQVVAALNLASHSLTEIPGQTRHALEAIAAQIGAAIARAKAETALRISNQNLQTMFHSILDFIFVLDLQGHILYANPAVEQRLGYSSQELIRMHVLDVHPPQYHAEVTETMAALAAGKTNTCPIPLMAKNGTIIPVETNVNRLIWNGREVLLGMCRDISHRLKIEKQLRTINAALLKLGPNPHKNIERLTHLAGEMIGATCALYNRLEGDMLFTTALWQAPPDLKTEDKARGHICFDVISRGSDDAVYVSNLPHTPYAYTDPNVKRYKLKTYLGRAVKCNEQPVGSLCVVFDRDYALAEDDATLLSILASAVGVEEERRQALEELRIYRHHLEGVVKDRTEKLQREIEERIQAEKLLQKSEETLLTLFNAAPLSIAVVQDGSYVFCNPAGLKLLGYNSLQELTGLPMLESIAPKSKLDVIHRLKQIATGQSNAPLEIQIIRPDGSTVEIETTSVPIEFEGSPAALAFARDLTAQQQAQELAKKLSRVVEQTADIVMITDTTGVIEYVNPAFEKITGYTRSDAIGQSPKILKSGRQSAEFYQELWATILAGNTFRAVFANKKKNGDILYEEKTITPLKNRHDEITHFVATGKDITQRQQAEQERIEREEFLTWLIDITQAALNTPDLPTLYQILSGRLRHMFEADICFLLEWDEDRQNLTPVAVDGVTPEMEDNFLTYRIKPNEPMLAYRVLTTDQPAAVDNVPGNPDVSAHLSHIFGAQSILSIPFIAGSQKLGATSLVFTAPHTFSAQEMARAEQISRQIALALAKVRSLEETNLRWREAETLRKAGAAVSEAISLDERVEIILEQLNQVLPYDSASVQLLRDNYFEIVSGRGFANPEQIIGLRFSSVGSNINARVIKNSRPIVLPDVLQADFAAFFEPPHSNIRSWLGVPLIVRDRVIGMLSIDSFKPNYFTDQHLRLVAPFANQVATALENASLYEQARQDAKTKAVLLSEVNHRVKNNLSVIIGLLYAERRHHGIKDDAVYQNIMQNLIKRVKGLSIVHNMLSASEWTPLPLSDTTNTLINAALQPLPLNKKVSVWVTPSQIEVTARQANNLALIINELATNTVKYALPVTDEVRITVTITPKNELVTLLYQDNGPGYPDSVLTNFGYNVGLYLVNTLVQDGLRGSLALYNDNGGAAAITFKLSE